MKRIKSNIGFNSIAGNVFEGGIQAVTKNIRTTGDNDLLDFEDIQSYAAQFQSIFGKAVDGIQYGDAKLTNNNANSQSIAEKATKKYLKDTYPEAFVKKEKKDSVLKRATGGGVPGSGSGDTVPALLTPGEFVINKKSAQAIGYNNLSKMNNVKKFASGGPVGNTAGASLLTVAGLNSVPILLKQFGFVNEGLNEFTNVTSSVVANFGLFNELLKTFKANDVGRALANTEAQFERVTGELSATIEALRANRSRLYDIATERARPGLAQTRIDELDNERDSLLAARIPLKDSRNRQRNRVDRLNDLRERRTAQLQSVTRLNQFAAAGSAVAFAGGNYLKNKSEADLQNGNFGDAKGKVIAAGALEGITSGAGTGAAIGSLFGPAGTIGGAIIGGIAGLANGIYSSYIDIQSRIDKIKFDKFFDKFSKSISLITSGKATAANLVTTAREGTIKLRDRVTATKGGDRQTAIGQIDSQIVNIETFLNELAKTSGSLEQFQKQAGGVTSFFAEFTGQTLQDVNKKFKDIIENQKKEIALSKERAALEARNTQRLRDIQNITAAFKDLSLATEALANSQKAYTDFLLNGSFSETKAVDNSELFSRVNNIADREQFERVTTNIGSNFGDGGKLASELIQNSQILQSLPSILVDSTKNVLQEGDFEKNVRSRLSANGRADGSFLTETLINAIQTKLGPEAKDEKIVNEIAANPLKVSEELAASLKNIDEVFKEAAPAIANQIQKTTEAFGTVRALRQKLFEGETKRDEITLNAERTITEGTGREFDTRKNITLRRQTIARQSGVAALGGVDLTAGSVEAGRQRVASLDAEIAKVQDNVQKTTELKSKRSNEVEAIESATRALTGLADASSDLSDLQDRLKKASATRDIKRGFAETFSFGSPEQKRSLNQNAFKSIALSRGARGPALQTPETLDFLNNIGSARLEAFGGKSGDEVRDETLRDSLSPFLSKKDIDAFLIANESEKEISQQIRDRAAEAVAAQTELNRITETGMINTVDAINRSTAEFKLGFEKLIAERNAKLDSDLALGQEAKRIQSEKRLTALDKIQGITTTRFSVSEAENQNVLKAQLPNLEALKKLREDKESLDKTGNIRDFLVAGGFLEKKTFESYDGKKNNVFKKTAKADDSARLELALDKYFEQNQGFSGEDVGKIKQSIRDSLEPITAGGFVASTINDVQDKLRLQALDRNTEAQYDLKKELSVFPREIIDRLLFNLKPLKDAIEDFGEVTNRSKLEKESLPIPLPRRASGGTGIASGAGSAAFGARVPGSGNKDNFLALLMPNEFVMNKRAVAHYGVEFMAAVNNLALPMMRNGTEAPDVNMSRINQFRKKNKANKDFIGPSESFEMFQKRGDEEQKKKMIVNDDTYSSGFGQRRSSKDYTNLIGQLGFEQSPSAKLNDELKTLDNNKAKEQQLLQEDRRYQSIQLRKKEANLRDGFGESLDINDSKRLKYLEGKIAPKMVTGKSKSYNLEAPYNSDINQVRLNNNLFSGRPLFQRYKGASEYKENPLQTKDKQIQKIREEIKTRPKESNEAFFARTAKDREENQTFSKKYTLDREKQADFTNRANERKAKLNIDPEYTRNVINENRDRRAKLVKEEIDEKTNKRVEQIQLEKRKADPNSNIYDPAYALNRNAKNAKAAIDSGTTAFQAAEAKKISDAKANMGSKKSTDFNYVKPRNFQYEDKLAQNRQNYEARREALARPRELARGVVNPPAAPQSVSPAAGPVPSSPTANRGTNGTQTQSSESTNQAVNNFAQNSENLIKALNNFPREISLVAKHEVQVIFNGAEVLKSITPDMATLAVSAAATKVQQLIKDKFPDMGNLLNVGGMA